MNDSKHPSTYTLARLYEAQGHAGRAREIYQVLESNTNKDGDAEKQIAGHGTGNTQSEEFRELSLLMGRWIDLLRRRRFFETKS